MDPLKKIQVEGYAMFAEPELLFGNLDELCCVITSFSFIFIPIFTTCISTNFFLLAFFFLNMISL